MSYENKEFSGPAGTIKIVITSYKSFLETYKAEIKKRNELD
jgi:hypothetical protein